MMKRMKKVGAVILVICVTFCIVAPYLNLWAGITLLSMKSVDAEPSIDRPDEINDYDPKVKIEETSEEDVLLDGIEYEMTFLQYNDRYGTAKPIENLNHEVTDDEESYMVALRVKNNMAEELSGAKFFIKLPDSVGEQSVVGDEMTLTAQLEYGGAVAQRQLNLTDKDAPIVVVFPSGAAGYIWKGNAEAERLPVYEEGVEVLPFDYWQDEGFELNVPAGEEWQLYVSVQAEVVTDFQVKTKISSAGGEYSGKKLSTTTVFGRKKLFHVVTKIANPTEIEESTEIWTYFDAGVSLVPGSVRLNGEQIDDFIVQEYRDDDTNFEVVNLGINMPHKIMTLEYDIEVKPETKSENARAVYVRSLVSVGAMHASTTVGCFVFNATIAVFCIAGAAIAVILDGICIIRLARRRKRVE